MFQKKILQRHILNEISKKMELNDTTLKTTKLDFMDD